MRCTRRRGPRGFFCLHDVCRGPVNVAVIQTQYMTSYNPFRSPAKPDSTGQENRELLHMLSRFLVVSWSKKLAIACLPIPFFSALFAWFTFPMLFFQLPVPVIPFIVTILGLFWVVKLASQILPATRIGISVRIVLISLNAIAILLAWPLGCELYSYLGFREPFP